MSENLTNILIQYQAATTKTTQLSLLPTLISEWVKTDIEFKDESNNVAFSLPQTRTSNTGFALLPSQAQALANFKIDPTLQIKLHEVRHKIDTLDSFVGLKTKNIYIVSNVHAEEILESINIAYHNLEQSIYHTLLTQTRLKPYLTQITLILGNEGVDFAYHKLEELINTKYQDDPINAFVDLAELLAYGGINEWNKGRMMLLKFTQDAKDNGVLDDYLALLDNTTTVELAHQYGSSGGDLLAAMNMLHKDVLEKHEESHNVFVNTQDTNVLISDFSYDIDKFNHTISTHSHLNLSINN